MDGRRAHDTDVIVTLFNCKYLADPIIQADPQVQQGNNSQNLNRYSYVLNNPLRYTDPSGYNFLDVAAKWMPTIMAVVVSISPAGPIAGGALAGWVGSSFTLKGDTIGALSGAIFTGVGVLSVIQGGQFGHGFTSAGLTKTINANDMITGIGEGMNAARVALAAVIGGSISLANAYRYDPNVTHTSSDGQKYYVAVDSLNSAYSFKGFEVQWNENARLFLFLVL